jgi:hypothetical protein
MVLFGKGRNKRSNMVWQQGRHKNIRFPIHFDDDSNEFNQLVQIGQLNLSGQSIFPLAPPNEPCHPHPIIMDIHEPHIQPANDGWNDNPANPPFSSNAK